MRTARRAASEILLVIAILVASQAALARNEQEVPAVDGDLGGCSALFTVHDSSGGPVYDAKIDVTIRYGFMNKRQTELQVGTNSQGKARFTGLPNFPKKPLDFLITSGTASKNITYDPSTDCNATFDLTLAPH
jgi:hypothetical protein